MYFVFWLLTSASWALKLCMQDVIPFCLKYTEDVAEMGGGGVGGASTPVNLMVLSCVYNPRKFNSTVQPLQTLQNQQDCPASSNPAKPTRLSSLFKPCRLRRLSSLFNHCKTNKTVQPLQTLQNQQDCPASSNTTD